MEGLGLHRGVEREADGVPFGVGVNIGAVTVACASFAAATLPASRAVLRLGVLVVVVGVFTAWAADAAIAGSVCVIAFLLLNSFLVNSRGELSWHGAADGWRLGALALAGGVGWWVGWVRRSFAAYNRFADLEALANGEPLPAALPHSGFTKSRVAVAALWRQAWHRRDPRR